jgi:hypothetical protein
LLPCSMDLHGPLSLFFPSALLLFTLLLAAPEADAQKLLQVERAGSLKTRRYFIGDELCYSLRSTPRQFSTHTILEIHPDAGLLVFADGSLAADSIAAIRLIGSNRWAKALSVGMRTFLITFTGYSLLDMAINRRNPSEFQYIAAGSALAGAGITGWLIPERVLRMGDNRRVRLLDLTFYGN